jgi:hypothetical protein
VVQTSDTSKRNDPTLASRPNPGQCLNSVLRALFAQPEMGAVCVIVADVIREQSLQVGGVDWDHVVEQFATAASHPAFGNSVLPRTANRSSRAGDFHSADGGRFSTASCWRRARFSSSKLRRVQSQGYRRSQLCSGPAMLWISKADGALTSHKSNPTHSAAETRRQACSANCTSATRMRSLLASLGRGQWRQH